MGDQTQQFKRSCLFCEGPNVTKTHVYARSFTGLFEDDGHEVRVRHDRTDPESGETCTLKSAKTFAFKPMAACQPCNGGWMKDLEDDVRPVLRGFAKAQRMTLSPTEQCNLTQWAVVAALLQMELEPEDLRFADREIARVIYRTRKPPPGTQAWVGANDHGEMGWFGAHSLKMPEPSIERPWGAALSFGHGNIHLVHHGLVDQLLVLRTPVHEALSLIWPSSPGVRWPPYRLVRERDLSPIAAAIAKSSTFRPS